jgi:hypothetical protein
VRLNKDATSSTKISQEDTMKKNSEKIGSRKNGEIVWGLRVLFAALLIVLTVPLSSMAAGERYVLDFNDTQIRGYQREGATIFLKKSLKAQYPGARIDNMELEKVVLVAKSKMGHGGAKLKVGRWESDRYGVGGSPRVFHERDRHSFDRVQLQNPSNNSRGPWQLDLKGNLIVRKIVLVVREHKRREFYGSNNRFHR